MRMNKRVALLLVVFSFLFFVKKMGFGFRLGGGWQLCFFIFFLSVSFFGWGEGYYDIE